MKKTIVRKIETDKHLEAYSDAAQVASLFTDPIRLELLDALAQGARTVDSLATVCDLPVRTVSHHLQKLRQGRLLNREKRGNQAVYSIIDERVLIFWSHLKRFSEDLHIRFEALETIPDREIHTRELAALLAQNRVQVIDVRPEEEFNAGHLPGAISMPADRINTELTTLSKNRPVIAFCRGPFCKLADRAVDILRSKGYRALRCADGIVEWRSLGMSVETQNIPHYQ
ncbi:MAG: ArsR family transcriptional regulator [Deltaproteobacteria bacterium]|nr:ArsR family transcriptional regulator [Deltaproteobacteria bacterium]MBN2674280.1 ArsR family transcriptional regulator [Deltaproteobacteria bacterium]